MVWDSKGALFVNNPFHRETPRIANRRAPKQQLNISSGKISYLTDIFQMGWNHQVVLQVSDFLYKEKKTTEGWENGWNQKLK